MINTLFHPTIVQWFLAKYAYPTDIQIRSWPLIANDSHVLITAPTGSGKTMAAFLWAIQQLLTGQWETGQVRVLYISPLKALNNDVQVNLIAPLKQLQENFDKAPVIRVQTRSGDTPSSERQAMIRKPPEILIITPEGLNLMISSKKARHIFSGLATVIIDEIHAVAGSKRGTHLITAVDRLVGLSGEFQRIGISATVRPLQTVADFMGGFRMREKDIYEKRKVHIVQSHKPKQSRIQVRFPENAHERDQSIWPALIQHFVDIINQNQSTLLFCNSRRMTEKVTRLINESCNALVAYSHHGSLSKEMRQVVEQKLKAGELKAIVATGSLELGIDIGALDEIVLVQTPFQISSAIQRLGRAGHSIDKISRARIVPTHGRDFLNAAIMARAMIDSDIEPVIIPMQPLDVLAQILISMTGTQKWDIDELLAFIKTSYPYHQLTEHRYYLVLDMLAGRYDHTRIRELRQRISLDKIDNIVSAKDGALRMLYISGGTIPDRGYFDLRIKDSQSKIGELDEEFVWERSVGESFVFGTQVWQIQSIDHQNVHVTPAAKSGMTPFWRAESIGRDYYFSEKVGLFLEKWNLSIESNDSFLDALISQYFMDLPAATGLIDFLKRQKQITQADLPHRHHLLIEHFSDPMNQTDSKQVILHTLWGGKVNQPFAIALSQSWEDTHGYPLHVFFDDDCVILNLPHEFHQNDILRHVKSENINALLRKKLEKTGVFGARFRENAAISLLLPVKSFKKRMPLWLNRLRAKKLLEAVIQFDDFPILAETWRTCYQDNFDIDNLTMLLDEIQQGIIQVTETITRIPSPFTSNVLWQHVNKVMYEDDTPSGAKRSKLRTDILNEIVYSSELRPMIPQAIINTFTQKRHQTYPGYSPASAEDVLDLLKDRWLIPQNEWSDMMNAIQRDHQINCMDLEKKLKRKIKVTRLPQAEISVVIALENESQIQKALKSNEMFQQLIESWLTYYGPVSFSFIFKVFGKNEQQLQHVLNELIAAQQIVYDLLIDKQEKKSFCDSKNLEILLRMMRQKNRPEFETLPISYLPLFLACWHKLDQSNNNIESLQDTLAQLIGFPGKAELWETDILPSRINPYELSWLDTLIADSDLIWMGQARQTLIFCFESEMSLFMTSNVKTDLSHIFPDPSGRYRLMELCNHADMQSQEMSSMLWSLFFKGNVSTDHFLSIRKGIETNFKPKKMQIQKRSISRRTGFNRWKSTRPISGNWYVLKGLSSKIDLLEKESMKRDQVRQLLNRYGILFRELLTHELPDLQWSTLIKTMRLMELSGEIISGCFFNDIPGLQFISHEAFRQLKSGLPKDIIYWLNASDPISMCGIGLDALKKDLPARRTNTHMVYHDTHVVLISKKNGKHLEFRCAPNAPAMYTYLSFFKVLIGRQFNPLPKVVVEMVNDAPVCDSPYIETLLGFGFEKDYNQLIYLNKENEQSYFKNRRINCEKNMNGYDPIAPLY
jgi:ATP-dependent Lhr-like helicase